MSKREEHVTEELFQPAHIDSGKSEEIAAPSLSFGQDAWRSMRKNKAAIFGIIVLIALTFLAIFGPMIGKYDFASQDLSRANLPPRVPVLEDFGIMDGTDEMGNNVYEFKGVKDQYFWLGTDGLGRDMWSRIWQGTRISLFIALLAAAIDLLIGVVYGGISAYYGGRVDNVMQRIVEILIGIPNLVLVILMILVLDAGITSIIIALTITGWIGMSRIVRGQMLKLKNQEFVLASRTLGATDNKIITQHLIPNVLSVIIINTMFTIPTAIFFEAFLSFIGLGLQPPIASLGTLIEDGYRNMQIFPHLMIYPSIIISLIMIAFNIVADGLRDALDPKMRD
ncbi:oligopeptide ABC transporter permease [Pseudalkalibacillus decolorationis]|uniref:oligopeptide ABC transporter permease n=1 Tax=Pseudalkalibacillus decolorationis TaxID=163879 RepID=UPI0021497200|nr:oligopeptide ABC transporter permease [Pseudalkalibacillus decolorationis]